MIKAVARIAGQPDAVLGYFVDEQTYKLCKKGMKEHCKKWFPDRNIVVIKDAKKVEFDAEAEIVKVNFESGCHADEVCYLRSEALYYACGEALTDAAEKDRMEVTESVSPDPDDLTPLFACLQDKLDARKRGEIK